MSISQYSPEPDDNTNISGINIAEGCPPGTINNAIRRMMADIATDVVPKFAELDERIEATFSGATETARGIARIAVSAEVLAGTTEEDTAPAFVNPEKLHVFINRMFYRTVTMWSGAIADIPEGWHLCDGGSYVNYLGNSVTAPNLTNRFIVGAGNGYAVSATGGATTHLHTVTVSGTALTLSQIPSHTHSMGGSSSMMIGSSVTGDNPIRYGIRTDTTGIGTGAAGGGGTHTHSATSAAASSLPPYYALACIIYLGIPQS